MASKTYTEENKAEALECLRRLRLNPYILSVDFLTVDDEPQIEKYAEMLNGVILVKDDEKGQVTS